MPIPTPSAARLHDFEVVVNEPVAQGVRRLVVRAPKLAGQLKPGQFLSIKVPGDTTQLTRLPFSYSHADAQAGTVEVVYAVVGDGTRRLSQMAPGATSTLLGPGGHGWRWPTGARRALVVAGGIGITPIVAAAEALGQAGIGFDAVVGALSADRLWGVERLHELGAADVRVTTDDGSAGTRGLVTAEVVPMLGAGPYDVALTCGPEPMMHAVADACDAVGVPCMVSMERMMTCGFGACATCVVQTTAGNVGACMGGPVFEARRVVW